jgi:hypothetical protein
MQPLPLGAELRDIPSITAACRQKCPESLAIPSPTSASAPNPCPDAGLTSKKFSKRIEKVFTKSWSNQSDWSSKRMDNISTVQYDARFAFKTLIQAEEIPHVVTSV